MRVSRCVLNVLNEPAPGIGSDLPLARYRAVLRFAPFRRKKGRKCTYEIVNTWSL